MRSSSFKLFGLVLVIGFALCIASSDVRTLDWTLEERSYTRLCSTKTMLTMNGMFPGPALHLHKGETVRVNVHNQGKYGVTIHWHGVKQPRNPWSDGPEYVAQCPIKPGANYTYEAILSDEEGTLWWHAHSDWTRATVHGPIFVLPAKGTRYPYSTQPVGEIPIFLASWYKGNVMEIITTALETGAETNKSDAFTINGQPGDTQPCSAKDMFTITVEHGKTYLVRIVNGIMNEEMFLMVANHKLTVVNIDASYIKPITSSYIMITPGQTMDVLLVANQAPGNYYMAARAFGTLDFSNATTTALVKYANATSSANPIFPTLPAYNSTSSANAFTRRFRSLSSPIDVPQTVDRRLLITIAVNTKPCDVRTNCSGPHGDKLAASLNNVTFVNPKIDVLQAYWKHLQGVYKTDFPNNPPNLFNYSMDPMLGMNEMSDLNGTRVIALDYNQTVEIVFQGANIMNSSEAHPMHLHGYSYYVVGSGNGNFNEVTSPRGYNLKDPASVSTISVPKNGWTAIRFRANNPGVWFMHCHLERHSSWGMDTVLIVKNGPTNATSMRPPHYINPC